VDDTLLRNHRLRQQVQKMVAAQPVQNLSVEDARSMAARIQKKGPQAVQALFDLLFDEDNADNHRMAIMLLSEMTDPAVFEKIHDLLRRPQLPEKVRVALLAIEAIHENPQAQAAMTPPPAASELSLDSLMQFTEDFWEAMDMEEIAMMWRENFLAEPPEDRLSVLGVLMKSANPKTLGIARLEIALGNLKILEFLAQKLGEFDSPMADSLLDVLLEHPNLAVRMSADVSLADRRQRANTAAEGAAAAPRFYRAFMATDQWSGHYSLVYAVKCPPDDLIKFVVVLLDRWDRGIMDCWGCVRYSHAEFEQLLSNMAKDFADLRQEQITKRTALTLIEKAMDLNVRRKHPLPLEFAIWGHLFENEAVTPDPNVPEFGVDCGVCHKPIRTGPRTAPPWVFADLVVCNRCSKRPLRCPICGGSTTLPECFLTRDRSDDPMDLRCPHCFESFQMP
jgi:hypothetical protein